MSRRMACSLTVDAVRDRTKTVTRRHVDSWGNLKVGDRLTLIEKGMGLKKGEKQVVLAEVEVIDVRVEPLGRMEWDELAREGFPLMLPEDFFLMWARSHGCMQSVRTGEQILCRRIEWRYL